MSVELTLSVEGYTRSVRSVVDFLMQRTALSRACRRKRNGHFRC